MSYHGCPSAPLPTQEGDHYRLIPEHVLCVSQLIVFLLIVSSVLAEFHP